MRKFNDEDSPWRRKRFPTVPERVIKTRRYLVTAGGIEHTLTISLEDDWYTLTLELSKPLIDNTGTTRTGFGMQGKDLQFLKSSVRNFLAGFGQYSIKPL